MYVLYSIIFIFCCFYVLIYDNYPEHYIFNILFCVSTSVKLQSWNGNRLRQTLLGQTSLRKASSTYIQHGSNIQSWYANFKQS